jgi:Family of unknown function (DUF5724)/Domain of unknown function (DUF4132)
VLRREEGQEQLKAFAADATRRGGAGLGRRLLAGPLAGQLQRWAADPGAVDRGVVARELDALNERQLARTFAVVCPALADALARWWLWAQAGPYQLGWARRGFRSSRGADSRTARIEALLQMLRLGRQWPQDISWFATWLSHVPHDPAAVGGLLASEITAGRTDIADTLTASAFGQHPISGITRAGAGALLGSDRPDRWEQVATLLRNAGRQEGLRSTVLEAVDLAHPDAFGRILDVVVADDLARFAGTVRAAGVWFGEELTVRTSRQLTAVLTELARALADPALAAQPGTPTETFIRLTALAHRDAHQAIPAAAKLLSDPDAGTRRAAARLLAELGLVAARDALRPALADADLTVYATAVSAWPTSPFARDVDARLDDDGVAVLLDRVRTLGKARKVDTGLIGSRMLEVSSAHAADVILAHRTVAAAPAEALAAASPDGRSGAARRLATDPIANRSALFAFLTDSCSWVRRDVYDALGKLPDVTADEAALLHDALRRKTSDLRQQAITLLLRQPADAIAASVTTLAVGTPEQARAADELAKRAGLLAPDGQAQEPGNAFPDKLHYRPADRTPAERPSRLPGEHFARFQPGCLRVVTSLRAWLSEHADVEVETPFDGVSLLANLRWLPSAPPGSPLPLPEVLGPWWERTAPTLTDGGVELLLLALAVPRISLPWAGRAAAQVIGPIPADRTASALVWPIIDRLARTEFRSSWIDAALDAATAVRAEMPLAELLGPAETMARLGRRMEYTQWGSELGHDARTAFIDPAMLLPLAELSGHQLTRLWRLARFVDEPAGAIDAFDGPRVQHVRSSGSGQTRSERVLDQPWRHRPSPELLCGAVDAGAATRGDLLDALLTVDADGLRLGSYGVRPQTLQQLSARRPPEWGRSAAVQAVVGEVRDAAIVGEVTRGDLPGPLTDVARRLRSAPGITGVVAVLTALGRRPFTRGYSWTDSRESSLSQLLRIHLPAPEETAAQLSAALTVAGVSMKRAVEFGVYAPQWAGMVEVHLGWPGFESAVWWVHAHSKDDAWTVDPQIREEWASAVSQRTALDSVDLVRGAADVEWFRRVVDELGLDRFTQVLAAAKYAASAGGHKRAEMFAAALLGRLDEAELLERIRTKRHQDSVRALGLLPLTGPHDPALLTRYELLGGFVASDRTSGSQRRASEATAVAIGMENLARSAGYRDPGRLTWAMEAEAVRDLAAGPVTAADGDLTVTLALDADGVPQLDVRRAGRALKAVPTAAAKTPAIAELKARVTTLRQQAGRMRRSLEASCVTGERFEPDEFAELLAHPVLAPMLRTLVVVTDEGVTGFPADDPQVLLGPAGEKRALDGSALRIAHPVDLLAGGQWPDLQHELFTAGRRQPFRQLFRELYVPTATETGDGPSSRRYAGQQVEGRRAAGLFTGRGWVADFEVGFGRTFHAEKITAWCSLLGGAGTAAEAEDTTIEEVTFVRAGSWRAIPIPDVPPRLFSEAMRDLDLVVSVAHAGRVNPETTESSTQMRRRLVEETAQMLGLDNVETTDHHARIRGKLGTYSVQLGSGVVHRQPGNALCIIPISAQHRGRIFLPFADDDPRTAEVISKVLLLARDDRIQDPTILEQLT